MNIMGLIRAGRRNACTALGLMLAVLFIIYIIPVLGAGIDAVTLASPGNDTWTSGSNDTIDFTFNYTGENETASCELFIDDTGYGVNSSVPNATTVVINANSTISDGARKWNVTCTNGTDSATSDVWELNVDASTSSGFSFISPTLANDTNTTINYIEINATFTESNLDTCLLELYNGSAVNYTMTEENATTCWFNATSQSDGNWYYYVYTNDSSRNVGRSSARHIAIDTTDPSVSLTCSPSSVTMGEIVTCSCTATDATSGVASTSHTAHPSTAAEGTQTTTCTATDNAGNSASASASYTVITIGGGEEPEPEPAPPSARKAWDRIEPGAEVRMTIERPGLDFAEIRIRARNRVNNAEISIEKLEEVPAEATGNIAGKAYQYVRITAENIGEANLETAVLRFRANKTWISGNNINKSRVYLNRYSDGKWDRLATAWVDEDADYEYYEAETPGFSVFAISGEESAAPACAPSEKQCLGNELQQCSSDGTAWEALEACPYGCNETALACVLAPVGDRVCTPGGIRCSGDTLQQCKSDGSAWIASQTCPYGCDSTAKACKSVPVAPDYNLLISLAVIIILAIIALYYFRLRPGKGFSFMSK